MVNSLFLPITDENEVESLIEHLPIAIDKEHFLSFVLGFPRKYLVSTPQVEIVRNYFLMESLAENPIISSLAREKDVWTLSLVTRDRRFLFSNVSGTLSCFGMNIVEAEAFVNADSLVLDTVRFLDPKNFFAQRRHKRTFHHFLEEVIERKKDLALLLKTRCEQAPLPRIDNLSIEMNNDSHPSATFLSLNCQDHFGVLYLVSRAISEEGCDIDIAYVRTPGQRVHDEFYITHKGEKLTSSLQATLKEKLTSLTKHSLTLEGSFSVGG